MKTKSLIIKGLLLLVVIIFSCFTQVVNAQTTAVINSTQPSGSTNPTFDFQGSGTAVGTSFTFNGGTLPSGWTASPFSIGQPCLASTGDTPDNTNYFWATTRAGDGSRFVQTSVIDVSLGGDISFLMRYGADDPNPGCEDPDTSIEGVFLQYTTNGGSTWTTIDTWQPVSGKIGPLYSWNGYNYVIPAAAQTANTSFRWRQPSSSGDQFDNWGLDDVSIGITQSIVSYDWDFDDGTTSISQNPTHTFPGPGSYDVTLTVETSGGEIASTTSTYVVNSVPTIDIIADASLFQGSGLQTANMTGITDGGIGGQVLTVTASSSNTGLIPNPTVNYTSANTIGSLSYTPVPGQLGTSTISVTVQYTNVLIASTTITFDVTVSSNDTPVGSALADQSECINGSVSGLTLTISDAIPGDNTFTVTATSSNTSLVANADIIITGSGNTRSIAITPILDATGTSTITVSIEDSLGATGTQTFDVTFNDLIPPTLTAVNDTNEDLDVNCEFTIPDYTGLTTANDNCGTATVTQAPTVGTVITGHNTVQTVTLTADDGNGNTNTTSFNITLVDITDPSLTAVSDFTEDLDANCELSIPDYTSLTTATDNCGTAIVTQLPTVGTVISGHDTVQTITLTADDGNGNTNTTAFDITLVDVTDPSLTTVFDFTEDLDANCEFTIPDYTSLTTATDNCGTATVTQSPAAGTVISGHNTVQTITLTADDGNGNTNDTTFNITLIDVTSPSLTTVADFTEELDANCEFVIPDYTGLTTATDNCGIPTVTQSPVAGTIISGHDTVQTITLTADDGNTFIGIARNGNGNTNSITFNITLVDVTDPSLSVVDDFTEDLDANCEFTIPDYTSLTTATDNCGTAIVTQVPTVGTVISGHDTVQTITLTADDGNGNTNTTTFDITLVDVTIPALSEVADFNEDLDANCEFTIPDYTSLTTATDNCGTATVTQSPAAGTVISGHNTVQTITLTADDGNGNTNDTTFNITLIDVTSPSLTTVADFTEELDANCEFVIPDYTGLTTATDNCGIPTVTQSPVAGTIISGHDTVQTITLTADDGNTFIGIARNGNGNTNSITFNITLVDVTDPSLSVIDDFTEDLDANCEFTIPDYTSLTTATDNCGTAIVTQVPTVGTVISGHDTVQTITLTADDGNGNTNTTTFDITLVDVTIPALSEVADFNEDLDANCEFTIPDYTSLTTATDNCGTATVTQSPAAGTVISGHNTVQTITLTASDGNGNTNTTAFNIMLIDVTDPSLTTVNDFNEELDGNCEFIIPDYTGLTTATDNCGTPTVTQSPPAGTVISGHDTVQTITLTADDGNSIGGMGRNGEALPVNNVNGNTNSTSFNITLVDVTDPSLSVIDDFTEDLDANCEFTIPDYTSLTTATDNCGTAIVTQSPAAGIIISGNNTVQTVTLTADDGNGNTNTTSFDITLIDVTAPDAIAQDITVQLDENGVANITPDQIDNLSTDTCGIDTYTLDINTFSCDDIGENTVTLTVTDINGNTDFTTAIVTVEDNLGPIVITQDITVQLDENGMATITANQIDNLSTDNCGIASYSLDIDTFSCDNLGENTVTLTITDVNGNASATTATVTVEDPIVPVAVAVAPFTVQIDEIGNAIVITPESVDNGSTDNCSIATMTLDQDTFTCDDLGENTVTLTVTDTDGNSATTTTVITVEDNVAPIIVTQDITVVLDDNGEASVTAEEFIAESFDNCSIETLSVDRTNFDCAELGDYTVTITATDTSGNTTTEIAIVTVTGDDNDGDLIADACDPDDDNDGILDEDDAFPFDSTPLLVPAEAFTPNGDNINDYWVIPGIDNYSNATVNVYNRWGHEVFKSKGYQNDWNGVYKSEILPPGSYLYVIDLGDGSEALQGWIFINY